MRAAARRKKGPLRFLVVKPRTVTVYRTTCAWFFALLREQGIAVPATEEPFDDLLCDHAEEAWQEGDPRGNLGNLLSGLTFFVPRLKKKLPCSWRLFAAWGRNELAERGRPLDRLEIVALAGIAASWDFLDVALLLLLG